VPALLSLIHSDIQGEQVKGTRNRNVVVIVALAGLVVTGLAALPIGPEVAVDPVAAETKLDDKAGSAVRERIVAIAQRELGDDSRNHERKTGPKGRQVYDNCNFYSGKFATGGGPACGKGWRAQAWCADFAKWVWKEAGAEVGGIDSLASSFQDYGRRNKTWYGAAGLKGVRPGDAVTYYRDGAVNHVGIVISVNRAKGTFTSIEGNTGEPNVRITIKRDVVPGSAGVAGFSGPVGNKAKGKGTEHEKADTTGKSS
jgi:hypothetical protein